MAGKFCKNCIAWDGELFSRPGGESFGLCRDPTASSKIVADSDDRLAENSAVYTESFFGCVYFRDRLPVLINLNDVLKDKK